jgi:hypothetical protein
MLRRSDGLEDKLSRYEAQFVAPMQANRPIRKVKEARLFSLEVDLQKHWDRVIIDRGHVSA